MGKQKRQRTPTADRTHRQMLEARQQRDDLIRGIKEPAIAELATALGALAEAADPMHSRALDAETTSRDEWDTPEPGAATRASRKEYDRIVKQVRRLSERAVASFHDPSWRPQRGPRCVNAECGRVGRLGDRFCGTCSSELKGETS